MPAERDGRRWLYDLDACRAWIAGRQGARGTADRDTEHALLIETQNAVREGKWLPAADIAEIVNRARAAANARIRNAIGSALPAALASMPAAARPAFIRKTFADCLSDFDPA